ncbi:MAG: CHAT domain-containing protein [Oscillatoriales cyanobacterium]|uniref:CHAT domain-containing protein n=2 Tax=Microcoleus TaxID=44471 RepID=UPI001DFC0987|nr:CHAT domain-containing tetratricopeptide repeat protein [Microcoleus sp. PH2017_27_LUM_O_A]TAE85993.1 MAG: CHAT domain-containing protein [Oscillatoriales cyanobacterium]TAE94446.1 MAG: CHAT domain-containing protein [Oscillatoriales cyanobacterium]TAF24008.1 MAG: CHAT domain-containing protein [Oscillatoriales cyanobacterium]
MEIAMNNDAANKTSQTYLDFWLEILQAILEGNDTPQGFYPILAANQDKLNEEFRILWRDWTTAIIDTEDYPEALIITDIVSNFSSLIKEFPLGNRAQNIEISITGLEMTQKIYSREVFPLNWARNQHNLGNAYRDRIFGDETENIKQGLAFYHNALEVFTPEEFPEDWARTKNNLAMAYAQRIRGKKAYNQELAFANYQDALEVYSREAFPRQWAMIQNNLVENSIKKSKNKAYNGEIAIKYCQSALQVVTREEFPLDWANIQHNLAAIYLFISNGERLDYLEIALTHSQEALQVFLREKNPYEWAFTQRTLGFIYKEKGEIKSATECLQLSLEIFTPALLPRECFGSALLLGDTAFITQNWTVAIQGYEKAIEAVEKRREWATNEAARQEIQSDAIDVYIKMVQACINDGQIEKALETVERSKSRNLVELLANSELYPKDASDSLKQELRRLRSTISSIRQLAQVDNNSTFNRDSFQGFRSSETSSYTREYIAQQRELLQEYQRQLDVVFAQCQELDPAFTLTQEVKPITVAEIRDLIDSHTAILEWYIGTDSFQIFIVTQSSLEVVQFDKAELENLEVWNKQYLEALFNNTETWQDNLSEWLSNLSQILRLEEILNHPALANCDSLLLVPHRYLHLFPLHALSVSQQTWKRFNQETPHLQPPANPCLLDCFKKGVRYAPSCQLLQRVQQRQRPPADTRTLFAIQNPTEDLKYTDIEVEVIKRDFTPADILSKQQATKTALIDNLETLAQAHYVHFSCHGSFDFQTPLISSLILAGAIESTDSPTPTGQKSLRLRSGGQANPAKCLTLQDIFATLNLPKCRLVTLSACETGLTDTTKQSDDCIGLATGFLYAGSQGVLSSLWSVDDFATAYLMIKCYENLATADMAVALNTAQIWLRDATQSKLLEWIGELKLDSKSTQDIKGFLGSYDSDEKPFESPFYWAAFCAIGN